MNISNLNKAFLLLALAASGTAVAAESEVSDSDRIAQYREMIADGNPAEFDEMAGEELWKKPNGSKHATLEKCDLGKGAGVVKGAYAELPRYFKDTKKVQDLESRLMTCMSTLQGIPEEEIAAKPFSTEQKKSDISSLATYVVGQSKGIKMAVSIRHPKEKEAYEIGKRIFNYRAGPYDFACSTCHATSNVRIRMQDLPNFHVQKDAQAAYTSWPAYRVSQGLTRSFQWRLNDCFRQQRFPEPKFASEVTIDLTMFLAVSANGAEYAGPGLKR
jgi:sulfur-oxidizing protein SoxA